MFARSHRFLNGRSKNRFLRTRRNAINRAAFPQFSMKRGSVSVRRPDVYPSRLELANPATRRKTLAKATAISLAKFTASVQAAIKGAVAKHPKFKVETPHAVSISYLIRGFPVPDAILSQVTLSEAQAYAADIAASLSAAHADLLAPKAGGTAEGAVLSIGRHIIVGIPPVSQVFELRE